MKFHHTKNMFLALCASAVLGGCGSMDVPDLNNPSLESLQSHPTRSGVLTAATGLLIGNRAGVAASNGYVAELGVIGREAYIFDGADPRFVTELLEAESLDQGSPAFGGNFWINPYADIRDANLLLDALDKVTGVTDAEKESTRGFAKTIQALDFLVVINTRDLNGAPIDVNRPIGDLAPIESKDAVLGHIAQLLDEAQVHLGKGGEKFPFPLSSGFDGMDKPATFIKFNRAVKARVDVYRGKFAEALTDLSQSFLNPSASLDLGAYYIFESGSGKVTNGLTSPNIFVHPSILAKADTKADGKTLDDRVTKKTKKVDSRTVRGLTSDLAFTLYDNDSAPVPIIRNEELILLRAEANIGLKNYGPAIDDLNSIRTRSGGVEPRLDLDENNIVDELLKQRRYSLLFEGGHSWIDARRLGKLASLPKDLENHHIHARFPLPVAETDARK